MNPTFTIEEHLVAFADAFVVPARRERWRYLLERRGKNAYRDSAKLMECLDARYCKKVDGDFRIAVSTEGVFYGFHDEPTSMNLGEAMRLGEYRDAIFSVVPGRLAIHWSHEGWSWICRR